ncbi:MAG: 7-carboxy-7-deazaguanine synthase QueE [Odoribacter sp.]
MVGSTGHNKLNNMLLAEDGIFPITKDKEGHLLPHLPASGFNLPGTIQGEGKLCGIPSIFVRLAGCNLHCCWTSVDGRRSSCDTAYAAYEVKGAYSLTVDDIYATLLHNSETIRHLVITGGEPLLQADELKSLFSKLKQNNQYHITLETNATLFDEEVASYIDLFSLSPKLSSSHTATPASILRLNKNNIQSYIHYARLHYKDFQLKFVYSCPSDIDEIKQLLSQLENWKKEDILLMPLGGTPEILQTNTRQTLAYCLQNGWRYCDRLHISLFGDQVGV